VSRRGAVGVAAVAAAVTAATSTLLRRRPPGGADQWQRTNFRGGQVSLLGGPAAAAGAVAGGGCIALAGAPGALVVTVSGAALGLYDDLAGETHARGLRGHLRALRQGTVTTGMLKMAGLAGAGFAAAALRRGSARPPALDAVLDGALVAGTANLVNLLDLRPGRALKVVTATVLPLTAGGGRASYAAAAVLATTAVRLPSDLAEREMLGDCGANALGALVGWGLAEAGGRVARGSALAVVVLLTLASERVSFSAVIDRSPVLRALDGWGRLPA
jgi:hypothetical protein